MSQVDSSKVEEVSVDEAEDTYEVGLTAGELRAILDEVPNGTEIVIEASGMGIDGIRGAIYFPRHACLSLVGCSHDVDIEEEDLSTIKIYGDIELYDPIDGEELEVESNQEISPEVRRVVQHALKAASVGQLLALAGPPSDDDDLPFEVDAPVNDPNLPVSVGEIDAPLRPAKE